MDKKILVLSLILLSSCNINWNGDIDLGGDFYYLVDPVFNSINVPVNPNKPYVSSNFVIQNIEQVGFNKKCILAISDSSNIKMYWMIDKTKKSECLGYNNNSRMILSNVNKIDSIKFKAMIQQTGVEMKSKTFYRKQLNYE